MVHLLDEIFSFPMLCHGGNAKVDNGKGGLDQNKRGLAIGACKKFHLAMVALEKPEYLGGNGSP